LVVMRGSYHVLRFVTVFYLYEDRRGRICRNVCANRPDYTVSTEVRENMGRGKIDLVNIECSLFLE
jgi:hypothetical protein